MVQSDPCNFSLPGIDAFERGGKCIQNYWSKSLNQNLNWICDSGCPLVSNLLPWGQLETGGLVGGSNLFQL